MGFLKKKSATKLSGGDGVLSLPTGKSGRMSPTASKASSMPINRECRDDAFTAADAQTASRSRSDSDSAANLVKTATTPPPDHHRGDSLSLSSIVSTSSPSEKVQATQGPIVTKSQPLPLRKALPTRPSVSAPAKVDKSKVSQHVAKGQSNPKSLSRTKPKSTKENKIVLSSRKYKSTPRPTVNNNWKREDALSVSSNGSSEASDTGDDDSEGSDDSSTDSDDDRNTFTDDDGNTDIFEEDSGSFVSIGATSTNTDDPDPDVSLDSCSSGETDDDDTGKEGFESPMNMPSPRLIDMLGKLGGWEAKKTEGNSLVGFPKNSGHADYLKKMDAFTVKNPDNQLLVQVAEHGNIEKLSIHVSLLRTGMK